MQVARPLHRHGEPAGRRKARLDDSSARKPTTVIPGRCEASNPESRDSGSGPSDHPGMTEFELSVASLHLEPSCSAKAAYPVRHSFAIPSLTFRNTGSPAFAGDDGRECGAFVFMNCHGFNFQNANSK